jgi:curved DNA-binding protein CbpA
MAKQITKPSQKPATRDSPPTACSAELLATIEILSHSLSQIDYFQLLQLPISANPKDIKDAYYRESRLYHPDRFHQLPDLELKNQIHAVYKRINEAYVVLRNDQKRAKYLADIQGPDREKKLRYTEISEAEKKAENKKLLEEQVGTTPKGRDCYKNGVKDLEAKRWQSAIRHFKTALMYEPANDKYMEKLRQSEMGWESTRPKNDFSIK